MCPAIKFQQVKGHEDNSTKVHFLTGMYNNFDNINDEGEQVKQDDVDPDKVITEQNLMRHGSMVLVFNHEVDRALGAIFPITGHDMTEEEVFKNS